MVDLQTIIVCIAALFACISTAQNIGQRQNNDEIANPRAYTPDAALLDFVYHDHDEMTRILR